MMIDSKVFKGIEYVQLCELPASQQEKLTQTINQDLFIKIMIDGQILINCLQFKDYSYWYHSVYKPEAALAPEKVEVAPQKFDLKQLVFK